VHEVVEASTHLAEDVGAGDAHVVEVQFGGVLRVQTHLVELATTRESRHVAFHN
jgi:hypothetical protein